MEVQGKIIMKLPLQQGTSRNGNNWMKQEYVLETNEAYPKKVHFDFFGERANQYNFEVGDVILLSFDIESREYNGRWYTDIRGWKAEKVDPNAAGASVTGTPVAGASVTGTPVTALASAAAPAPAPAVAASMAPIPAATDVLGGGDGDEDLPF